MGCKITKPATQNKDYLKNNRLLYFSHYIYT